ncbi:hypothetical protein GCM10022247_39950 [Allokutzneria multivorans]|uniref:Secreted protein n=1 Tax=Allokutzneria multivorans TaxID=1142134 RepID=A0ABP7SLI4_9PSEU
MLLSPVFASPDWFCASPRPPVLASPVFVFVLVSGARSPSGRACCPCCSGRAWASFSGEGLGLRVSSVRSGVRVFPSPWPCEVSGLCCCCCCGVGWPGSATRLCSLSPPR